MSTPQYGIYQASDTTFGASTPAERKATIDQLHEIEKAQAAGKAAEGREVNIGLAHLGAYRFQSGQSTRAQDGSVVVTSESTTSSPTGMYATSGPVPTGLALADGAPDLESTAHSPTTGRAAATITPETLVIVHGQQVSIAAAMAAGLVARTGAGTYIVL